MRNKKIILSIGLLIAMLLVLVGCNNKNVEEKQEQVNDEINQVMMKDSSEYNLQSPYTINTVYENESVKPFNIEHAELEKYIAEDEFLSDIRKNTTEWSGGVKSVLIEQELDENKIGTINYHYSAKYNNRGYIIDLENDAAESKYVTGIHIAISDGDNYQMAELQVYKLLLRILGNEELAKGIVYSTNLGEVEFNDSLGIGSYSIKNASEDNLCRIYLTYYKRDANEEDNLYTIKDAEIDFGPLDLENLFTNGKIDTIIPTISNDNEVQWNPNFIKEFGNAKITVGLDRLLYMINRNGKYEGYQIQNVEHAGEYNIKMQVTELQEYPNFESVTIHLNYDMVADQRCEVQIDIVNNNKDMDKAISLANNIAKYFDNNINFINEEGHEEFDGEIRGRRAEKASMHLDTNTRYVRVNASWSLK